jgi:uncharacterized protein (DUF433 family)
MFDRIECSSDVLCGQPVIKGTRMPVYAIVEAFASGENAETLIKAYPYLTLDDVNEALRFAAKISTCRMGNDLSCPSVKQMMGT